MKQASSTMAPRARDFQSALQEEFVRRCKANVRYSLRAYAKSLRISPSPLSAMLRGTRPITEKMKYRLGAAIGLKADEIKQLRTTRQARAAQVAGGQDEDEHPQVVSYGTVDLDTFALISDWYHVAILELMKTRGFVGEPKWIARALDISPTEASIAIQRLRKAGIVSVDAAGKWTESDGDAKTNIHGTLTSAAARKTQKQVLEKAIQALEEIDPEERNHTTMTMAIHRSLVPVASERIKKFRRSLCAFLQEESRKLGGAEDVYNLAVSLYPVTCARKEKKK